VPLGDVYEVIGYYLRHSPEFDQYFRARAEAARLIEAENERRRPAAGICERMRALRATPSKSTQPN